MSSDQDKNPPPKDDETTAMLPSVTEDSTTSPADPQEGDHHHVAFQLQRAKTEEDEDEEERDIVPEDHPLSKPPDSVVVNGDAKQEEDEARDKLPYLKFRQSRFSTASSPILGGLTSRPSLGGFTTRPSFGGMSTRPSFGGLSFGNLSSRPSMVSLRSTISRVNSELYPERGSIVAYHLGESLASVPPLAQKMYIITQVSLVTFP